MNISPYSTRVAARVRGFTLIELLVTLSIAAILALLSTSFSDLSQRNQLIAAFNTLVTDMNYARSEAIKTGEEMVICISSDGINCIRGDDWRQGWIIYQDSDGDRRRDQDETIKKHQNEILGSTLIRYNGRPVDNFIRFQASGSTQYNGTFSFCALGKQNLKRALILSNTGRLRSASTKANGHPIVCPTG